jgi:hypothetical protein
MTAWTRTLACLAVAMCAVAGTATQASAEPKPPKTIDTLVAEQLDHFPGGTRISKDTVSYENGQVLVVFRPDGVATPAAKSDCPEGWACLWRNPSFGSTRWQFHDEGYYQNLEQWGATPFLSFYNRRSHNMFLRETSTSAPLCYPGYGASTNLGSSMVRYSEWIYLANTGNNC